MKKLGLVVEKYDSCFKVGGIYKIAHEQTDKLAMHNEEGQVYFIPSKCVEIIDKNYFKTDEDFVQSVKNDPRYVVSKGKFGCYFYDNFEAKELTLEEVKIKLNLLENIRKSLSSLNLE